MLIVLRNGFLVIPLFVLTACNSGDVRTCCSETMRKRNGVYPYNSLASSYGLNKICHMSKEQKKEYLRQQCIQRLQERGRTDNSTDSVAGFGW